ncbi:MULTISPECIES: hypothetical protein [unclassified Streptomyces]|uniref:hypothetical protein n=1 Tax=unclassified Streptomyces TaxID=2593676 RepID=UPI0036FC4391
MAVPATPPLASGADDVGARLRRAYEGEFARRLDGWSAERLTGQVALLDALGE